MIELECRLGPARICMKTDSSLHPEIVESLLTNITIKTAIIYAQMLKDSKEAGVLVVEEDE